MTGGSGLVAYLARYGQSGIMTFIVNRTGIAFQKDLGAETATAAAEITEYDLDQSWQPVTDELWSHRSTAAASVVR